MSHASSTVLINRLPSTPAQAGRLDMQQGLVRIYHKLKTSERFALVNKSVPLRLALRSRVRTHLSCSRSWSYLPQWRVVGLAGDDLARGNGSAEEMAAGRRYLHSWLHDMASKAGSNHTEATMLQARATPVDETKMMTREQLEQALAAHAPVGSSSATASTDAEAAVDPTKLTVKALREKLKELGVAAATAAEAAVQAQPALTQSGRESRGAPGASGGRPHVVYGSLERTTLSACCEGWLYCV